MKIVEKIYNSGRFSKGVVPWNRGKTGVYSAETLKRMGERQIGRVPWNKGKPWSKEVKIKMSLSRIGKKTRSPSKETREKIANSLKNHPSYRTIERQSHLKNARSKVGPVTQETREKMRLSKLGISTKAWTPKGKKSHLWKGGITPIVMKIRGCLKMREWKISVLVRDKRICQECFSVPSRKINAHHIIPFREVFAKAKEEYGMDNLFERIMEYKPMWDISNGITLCGSCHIKTDDYLNKGRWLNKI